jgi:RNA polymerase sigma-70 factor (ECF subfamily)
MPSSEEQLLVKKIQEGDQLAWSDLVLRYEGRLTNYAQGKIKDHASCQDLVQESFLGFLANINNFDASRSIQSYLFGILSNKITDLLRSYGRLRTVETPVDSSGNQKSSPYIDPAMGASTWYRGDEKKKLENDALIKGLGLLINQFIQRKDYLKLKSIELLFVKGLSNLEAANILGIDNKTVASHRHYANNFIIEHLKKLNLSPDVFPQFSQQDQD